MFFQSFVLMSSLSSQVQEGRPWVDIQAGERGVLLLGTRKAASSQKRGKDNRDRERDRDTEAWGEGRDGETRTETVRERQGSDGGERDRKRNQRHTHEPAPLLKQKDKVCLSQLT